ncbi:hypothetical protein FB566_0796 [Stackebrandtia endophytica]|uniref:Disulfide bond formation protein DsbA n=1 Tax=Stackebrandtia endophytica TaxID=1496996 RepID=A0A543ARU1_9ACTN|nr:disulfide bond formation protein DsbA [Stackebrandtia endophytica]TQL75299.1 hypothetical protein FB566_0796 [Stackebrandtia endophytica]
MAVVDVWFDPSCPYTWVTANWLLEVERVRPIELRWNIMSLSVLNEDKEIDPEGDTEGYLWLPVRICAAVEQEHGHTGLRDFYFALGRRLHEGAEWDPEAIPQALIEAGLPVSLADQAWNTDYDQRIRASHERGVGLVGTHVGTPIISVTDEARRSAWFGPVLSRVPRGEVAGTLFDAVSTMVAVPGFHEVKTTAPSPPDLS